jgi:aryl-alcohol dehydrogenase-like predicted oxidoreductase
VETGRVGSLEVSRVGLGCNNFGRRLDLGATRAVIDAALDVGVTFLDTADIYGGGDSERFIGDALRGRRGSAVIATKFGHGMGTGDTARGSADYVRRAVEASLARLQTDHVDLLYYHRPDGVTPLEQTIGAMEELVREGKAREIACSNLDAQQLEEVGMHIVALQNEYSLLRRDAEREVLPLCRELGVAFVPYFPLASGLLTGKYKRGEPAHAGTRLHGRDDALTDDAFDVVEWLEEFAAERGRTVLELAIAGLASQPGIVSVIAGATKPEQVRANAAAADWHLTAEELEELLHIPSGTRA